MKTTFQKTNTILVKFINPLIDIIFTMFGFIHIK